MKTWVGIGVFMGLCFVLAMANIMLGELDGEAPMVTGPQARQGFEIATSLGCVACHTLDGSPGIGPTWKGMWGRTETLTDGSEVVVDAAYIRESILDPGAKVVAGYDNVMLSYRLTDEQLQAIVAFTREFGDGAGEINEIDD